MADSVDGDGTVAPDEVVPAPEPATRRLTPRALALWGVLGVLALGAGALVVTSADDDPPKLPVALGAPGGARSESLASPAADMSMLAWVHYVAGDDLPVLGGDGPAYKLSGEVDEGRVRDLADALGIDGDVTRREGAWVVDGDGGHLEVYEGAGASWWYSPEDPNASVGGGTSGSSSGSAGMTEEEAKRLEEIAAREAGAEGSTETTLVAPVPDCAPDARCDFPAPEPITPPADLPTEDEAREIALDLFEAAGLDVTGAKISVDGPHDAWYVMVEPLVDGRPVSGVSWSASIGSKGRITSAGGALNDPERLGDYPVLDTRGAIDRVNEQALAYQTPMEDGGVATEEPTTTLAVPEPCVTPTREAETEEAPTTKPADDPDTAVASDDVASAPAIGACEPPVPVEPVEVVLHEADEILVVVSAFDGTNDAYLVPGYRMTGDDGHVVEVAAVDDDSLLPEPDPVEPQPAPADDPVTTVPGAHSTPPAEPTVEPDPG